jgi:D-beta-D-heptose 7-phosphate kinase/D-beta-D-heptose 1-phosphate adenosyltransferase
MTRVNHPDGAMAFDTRAKIVSRDQAARQAAQARAAGRKVVFTNGCFDLLHAGHVRLLEQARSLGDFLVLGLNSDQSVRSLGKGDDRPLVPQAQRAQVVAALAAVDMVTLFDEPTPLELITAVLPDVLVKGGDWPVKDIVGAELILARGGRVESLPLVEGLSTTALAARIRSRALSGLDN